MEEAGHAGNIRPKVPKSDRPLILNNQDVCGKFETQLVRTAEPLEAGCRDTGVTPAHLPESQARGQPGRGHSPPNPPSLATKQCLYSDPKRNNCLCIAVLPPHIITKILHLSGPFSGDHLCFAAWTRANAQPQQNEPSDLFWEFWMR
jgi:hypothetical protein